MSIVMGLDQHRESGTTPRPASCSAPVWPPADRAGVRKFLSRFRARGLAVALEATTGWRFVVEELRRFGAEVHLAEAAEIAGLRGPKERAKGDRTDPGICGRC